MPDHVIVWEFLARQGLEEEFARAYGPEGDWARLFGRAPGYRGTTLLRDSASPRRFLTIDRWESRRAFEDFQAAHGGEYQSLDRRLAPLSEEERRIGSFEG